jgi:hypothetical protein
MVISPWGIAFFAVAVVVKTMSCPLMIAPDELEDVTFEELLTSAVAFGIVVEPAVVGLSEEQAASAIRAIAPAM